MSASYLLISFEKLKSQKKFSTGTLKIIQGTQRSYRLLLSNPYFEVIVLDFNEEFVTHFYKTKKKTFSGWQIAWDRFSRWMKNFKHARESFSHLKKRKNISLMIYKWKSKINKSQMKLWIFFFMLAEFEAHIHFSNSTFARILNLS